MTETAPAPRAFVPTRAHWEEALPRVDIAIANLYERLVPKEDLRAYALAHVATQSASFDPTRVAWSDYVGATAYYGALDGIRSEVGRAGSARFQALHNTWRANAYDEYAETACSESDPADGPVEAEYAARYLRHALGLLDPRGAFVVRETLLEGRTLADVGGDLGVTESRVSQLRSAALSTLRTALDPEAV